MLLCPQAADKAEQHTCEKGSFHLLLSRLFVFKSKIETLGVDILRFVVGHRPRHNAIGHRQDTSRFVEVAIVDRDLLPSRLVEADSGSTTTTAREVAIADLHHLRANGTNDRATLLVAAILEIAPGNGHIGTRCRFVRASAIDVDRQAQNAEEGAILDNIGL